MTSRTVTDPPPVPATSQDTRFFGHPRSLATLFFTEMWERFSYYGMRALLILFMTAAVSGGGLGFDVAKAGAIYGLYTSSVYLMSLPGGWIADRVLGQHRAVICGGVLIMLGGFSLVVPNLTFFYLGLFLNVLGTGLLKPNVTTMVGQLYAPDDHRRDAGFSIYYMGINVGAMIAPLACGYVGETINWHWGFGLAGIGMLAGLIQYLAGSRHLSPVSMRPVAPESPEAAVRQRRSLQIVLAVTIAVVSLVALLALTGTVAVTPVLIADAAGYLLAATVVAVFTWLLFGRGWSTSERKRCLAIVVLFLASAFFWSAFEQAGSTLNLFAKDSTRREVIGYAYPASWFQSLNSLFIMALAPLFAWLWVRLGTKEPPSPGKFSLGLIFVGLGFVVMVGGAMSAATGLQVSAGWLVVTYFLHTIGELCLSPVGLSAITKLAPARVAGLMMGVWFLSISTGNYIGGRLASFYASGSPTTIFLYVAGFCIALGVILALSTRPITRLMGGVK